jgi:hypothetical protein
LSFDILSFDILYFDILSFDILSFNILSFDICVFRHQIVAPSEWRVGFGRSLPIKTIGCPAKMWKTQAETALVISVSGIPIRPSVFLSIAKSVFYLHIVKRKDPSTGIERLKVHNIPIGTYICTAMKTF